MKSQTIKRTAAMIMVAFLATGALAACGVPEAPKLTSLGAIEDSNESVPADEDNDDNDDSDDSDDSDSGDDEESDSNAGGDLEVGRCFTQSEMGGTTNNITVNSKDCSLSHDAEFYYKFESKLSAFSYSDLTDEAKEGCYEEFAGFVGKSYETSSLEGGYMTPNRGAWDVGKRTITCYVVHDELVTGSAKGSAK